MAVLADDDVIVNGDAKRLCGFDDHFRHVDIGSGGCRIAGGVVVDENERGGREFQRPLDHFTRIDGRVIDRACLLHFVGDQGIAFVEEENAKLFAGLVRHGGVAIFDHR